MRCHVCDCEISLCILQHTRQGADSRFKLKLKSKNHVQRHSFSNVKLQKADRWSAAVARPGVKSFVERPLLKINEIIQRWQKRRAFDQWKHLEASNPQRIPVYSTHTAYSPKENKPFEDRFQYYSDRDEYGSDYDKLYPPSDLEEDNLLSNDDAAFGEADGYGGADNIFSATNGELLAFDQLTDHYISKADFSKENLPTSTALPINKISEPSMETKKPRESISKSIMDNLEHAERYLNSTRNSYKTDFLDDDNQLTVEQPFTLTDIVFEDGLNGGFEFSP